MTLISSSSCSFRYPSLIFVYVVGLGFIYNFINIHSGCRPSLPLTFLLPPVMVTLTKRRV